MTDNSLNPQTQHEIIAAKIADLQAAILSNNPQMPLLLRDIHSVLKNDPAVVTILREEEDIATIIKGLEKQTKTYLVESMTASKTGSAKNKALSKVSSSDLGF